MYLHYFQKFEDNTSQQIQQIRSRKIENCGYKVENYNVEMLCFSLFYYTE